MGIKTVTTAYGQPALEALRTWVIRAKQGDTLAPATVIVPTNHVGVASRRGLARGPVAGTAPGLAAVTFSTAYRLAELLGAPRLAATGRRPVSNPVLTVLIRQVLAEHPGVFAAVATHPTTERRLVAAHRELSEVSGAALDAIAATSPRARDVVAIHRAARALLEPRWYEEQDLCAAALAAIDNNDPLVDGLGPVAVHLPIDLRASQAALLRRLGEATSTTVIAGLTGVPDADALVTASLARLGLAVRADTPDEYGGGSVRAVSVSDPDDEVRHVVRGVVRAARQGIPLDRMAAVFATDVPYARLLHEHLSAAGIPVNGAAVASVAASMAGRTVLQLLGLADRGLRRDDLSTLLAGAPIRWRGRRVPSRAWEIISRNAGVVGGLDDWTERLDRYEADLLADADAAGHDPNRERRARMAQRDLRLLRQQRDFVTELAGDLSEADHLRSWTSLSRWCDRLIGRRLGDATQREAWPEPERRAADRVEEILDRLASLDAIDAPVDRAVFSRTLALELEAGLGRVGRIGDGILVGRASLSAGLHLDRIWILGVSEGTFPSRPREDSLLPDRERRAAAGELPLRAAKVHEEHRQLLASLAAASSDGAVAVITWPRGDLRTTADRVESRWLEATGAEPRHVASFNHGLLTSGFPPTVQEYDLKDLVDSRLAHPALTGHRALDVPALARGVACLRSRSSAAFTRFDGNLAGHTIVSPFDPHHVTSATRLEMWAGCPHAYFMRYLLGVEAVEDPERRLRLDALARGSLVHHILERFVAEQLAHPPGPGQPWPAAARQRLHDIAEEEFELTRQRGLTGANVYWRIEQRAISHDLDIFLDKDNAHRAEHGLAAVATELGFGFGDDRPARVTVGDRSILVRGSIDRVDRGADGGYAVVDYKTGRSCATLSAADPHQHGSRLQLMIYANALRDKVTGPDTPVHSEYWFVTSRGNFVRRGYHLTPEIEAAVGSAISVVAEGIAGGVFPQHPDASTRGGGWVSCHYCDPDGLGTREARRRFEHKAAAPELAAYVTLTEPDLLPDRALIEVDS